MDDATTYVMKAMQSCRCCLLRPPDRGLNTMYTDLDKTEIYSDMLRDCFNIHLALGSNESGICEVCVSRLRDASDFKSQVQRSQALLETALRANDQKPRIKVERSTSLDMANDDTQYGVENLGKFQIIMERMESSDTSCDPFAKKIDDEAATTHMRVAAKREPEGAQPTQTMPAAVFKCNICDAMFTLLSSLDKHMKDHKEIKTEEKKHPCDVCQKEFKNKSHLKSHMQTHMGSDRPTLKCEFCPLQFFHKTSFKKHIRLHVGEKPTYNCDVCGKKLASQATLKHHTRLHKGEKAYPKKPKTFSKKTIFCEVCGKGFPSQSSFTLHMNVHKGLKPYSCDICHEQFTQKGSLKGHMHIHTGEKPYSCEICHKRFGLKAGVKNHMLVHTLEKSHTCEFCNKQFKYKAACVAHIKLVHSGEKPHACVYCNKAFALLSMLRIHTRIHTGERPYVCDICSKGFVTRSKLTSHLLIHSNHTRDKRENLAQPPEVGLAPVSSTMLLQTDRS